MMKNIEKGGLYVSTLALAVSMLSLLRDILNYEVSKESLGLVVKDNQFMVLLTGCMLFFIIGYYYNQKFSKKINITLYLKGKPDFNRADTYECKYLILDTGKGGETKRNAIARWEAGHLAVTLTNVDTRDLISLEVKDLRLGKIWKCDYFYVQASNNFLGIEMEQLNG